MLKESAEPIWQVKRDEGMVVGKYLPREKVLLRWPGGFSLHNPEDGEELWKRKTDYSGLVNLSDSMVYSKDSKLNYVDYRNGRIKDTVELNHDFRTLRKYPGEDWLVGVQLPSDDIGREIPDGLFGGGVFDRDPQRCAQPIDIVRQPLGEVTLFVGPHRTEIVILDRWDVLVHIYTSSNRAVKTRADAGSRLLYCATLGQSSGLLSPPLAGADVKQVVHRRSPESYLLSLGGTVEASDE